MIFHNKKMRKTKKKIICIIQARVNSTRLPGKILLNGFNKPLIIHLIERIKKSKFISNIIIATTNNKLDRIIPTICKQIKIDYFKGNEQDVLSRYFYCAKKFNGQIIVRITSDCPLMDVNIVDKVINSFINSNVDYVSNVHPPSEPDGFDVEVFSFEALRKSFYHAKKNYEREHVTPYMWDNPKIFKLKNFSYLSRKKKYHIKIRLTLDYNEDYSLIYQIYQSLYKKNKFFNIKDVLRFLDKKKELSKINKKYIKVNWYRHHLKKLKTIKNSATSTNL